MHSEEHELAQDQYAEVDGLRLCYRTEGHSQDMLLLHGLRGSVEDWVCSRELMPLRTMSLMHEFSTVLINNKGEKRSMNQ